MQCMNKDNQLQKSRRRKAWDISLLIPCNHILINFKKVPRAQIIPHSRKFRGRAARMEV